MMKLTYEDGFKAGYQKGYEAGRLAGPSDSSQKAFVVTVEDQEEYPEYNLPLGKKVELIMDLGGHVIGYQPLNE